MPEVLLAGVSMRAAAVSAARAGFGTYAIDAFADLDLPAPKSRMSSWSFSRRLDRRFISSVARKLPVDAVVYGSGFEHHSKAVEAISELGRLWGNPPEVLRKVRSPRTLLARLASAGFQVPRVFFPRDRGEPGTGVWLEKPLRSGGGHGVRRWLRGFDVPPGFYLEEFIDGLPGSIVFVAVGGRAVPLGISRQLAGDPAFGATGYRYCGSILSHPAHLFARGMSVAANAVALAAAVARQYSLVGLNNVDFIARDGVAYPVEVNPRWSASVELVERAHGFSMFGLHADACSRGTLPDDRLQLCLRRAVGKAVVFARSNVFAGRTGEWLWQRDLADVPPPGTHIRRGEPICTVFAQADDPAACHRALIRRAETIYDEVGRWSVPLTASYASTGFHDAIQRR